MSIGSPPIYLLYLNGCYESFMLDVEMAAAARGIVEDCLDVQPGEEVLVIADAKKSESHGASREPRRVRGQRRSQ